MTNVVYHLNMKRLFLIVFLFSSLNLLFSQGFQKGFIALKSKNYQDSIEILESEFESRHGIEFSENLLQKVKKYFK
jgi:hypothetical protein